MGFVRMSTEWRSEDYDNSQVCTMRFIEEREPHVYTNTLIGNEEAINVYDMRKIWLGRVLGPSERKLFEHHMEQECLRSLNTPPKPKRNLKLLLGNKYK